MLTKPIILLIVLLSTAYRIVLGIVELRSANNPTPDNVSDVYDAETYANWKRYSREKSRLSLIFTAIGAVISLTLLATNAYSAFASLFPTDNWFLQPFAIILLDMAVNLIPGIVRSYVFNMVVEQKYGFNRTTIKTFIFDQIRSNLLELFLSLALVMLLLGIHILLGDWLIVAFAAAMFLFSLFISFMYPIFSRIGNKFTPLEDGELKDKLMELLTKHGYKVKAIEVMDASRRTTKLNAYFTGFGKMKTIVLYDNLVNSMSTEEICAVFAHELGHGLHKDVLKNQILNVGNLLLMGVLVWLAVREPMLHEAFGFAEVNYGFAYILVGAVLALVQPLTGMIMNARSRAAEYKADAQAVKEGYGEAMITALKKLARENFAHLAPARLDVLMDYSHPPLAERIAAVEKQLENK
ncbi:MAG: M48 family metallopeptidase [Clostridia bacterium]|nr:M48 family metallopeptidase [Clostridia bacterium]